MNTRIVLILIIIVFSGSGLYAEVIANSDSSTTEGPGSYTILRRDTDRISIPFKMHNGKPVMELEINGEKATLMIDNGVLWDQIWLFGSKLVEELELKPTAQDTIEGQGEGDPTQAYTSTNLILKFHDIVFYEQPSLVSPPVAGFANMFPGADGQLCNTFFKHFIVEFDFINNNVILHDPKQFNYNGNGYVLDMHPNGSGTYAIPFTFTMLDGKVYSDLVDIDLGGIYPLKIALNNKNNIQLPPDVAPIASYGAQGQNSDYRGKIKSMTVGKYTFNHPIVYFGDEKTSRIHPDNLGVVGLPLFQKFNIIFDYFNNKLYLEPNKNYQDPFE